MVEKKDLSKLCFFCFNYLEAYLKKIEPIIEFPNEYKGTEFPLFVTWKKGKDEELRGCIGTFKAENLEENLPKYAIISALNDNRFSPISLKEIKDLHVGVSLLTDFEDGKDCYDWEVGIHGIQIFYKKFNATFLPEVAYEQGWDKKTTLEYLLRKSGCNEKLSSVEQNIKLIRYQSVKKTVSFNDYEIYFSNTKI